MSNKLDAPMLFLSLAIITSIITGVGLFVSDFGGWYVASVGWYYVGAGLGLVAFGVVYLLIMLICILGLLQGLDIISFELPDKTYLMMSIYCWATFIIFIIGGIVFAVEMMVEDYEFWFEFAFYAGLIGSPLTGGFLLLAYKTKTS
ncbi:MAG: hypothetical protein ACTSVY_03505 [Candidatus Helarchaeota archaeon]